MEQCINIKMKEAIWTAHQLFEKQLVTGSTGNISFLHENIMYISQSGSCFGRIDENSFSKITMSGEILEGVPSKEYPIHLALYNANKNNKAVIHTHSLNSTVLSCAKDIKKIIQQLLSYTPYLNMLTKGEIGIIPNYLPGSEELFAAFRENVCENINIYLLSHHGLIVTAESLYRSFDMIEEFEVSAKFHIISKCLSFQEF